MITTKMLLEILDHEAIVTQAYKDSKNIWTWGVGVTDASGHRVLRYKDNPQTVERCVDIFKWLLETKYLPDVLEAFEGFRPLTENELAAALSFHYNTGAIKRASWVRFFKTNEINKAKISFLEWKLPPEIVQRRRKEADLLFNNVWANKDGKVTIIEKVRKPSYQPDFRSAKRVEVDL